jgi:hypothetical protein
MHTLGTFFAALMIILARIRRRPPEPPMTPERLIRMGAGN